MSTSSLEKTDAAACVASFSDPGKAVTTSQSKARKAKLKVQAGVAAGGATQLAEEDDLSTFCVDHPYFSVLYKRIRTHRKKLEKIKSLEQAQAKEGKVLNAQQLELMSNKARLEKLVAELEMLRDQFVGVYNQELAQKQQHASETSGTLTTEGSEQIQVRNEREEKVVQEAEMQTVEKETQAMMATTGQTRMEQANAEDMANVYELLKALHVVNLYQALGKEVPIVLDFFSKLLLGNTRPPAEVSYEENLFESLEEAKKYLMKSDKLFACDTTYSGLHALVNQLASTSSTKLEKEEVKESGNYQSISASVRELRPSDAPLLPAEINTMPQISFFTESELEHKQSAKAVADIERTESHVDVPKVVVEVQHDPAKEVPERNKVRTDAPMEAPPAPEPASVPTLSFAAVVPEAASGHTMSHSASSDSSENDKKKKLGLEGDSTRGKKNSRHRGQGRWREKGSSSISGDPKSGNESVGSKPRHSRASRPTDENGGAQGGKRSGSKEGKQRPRVDRSLSKQGHSPRPHTPPMIAPHA
ncbi:hypothetical protein PsorP6_018198 [Peronosclerospora sorghi]|uniref:Uncharacterized protein n=1 Tax=Peronosclerospora sorghi TaxID=230839 RepID=A0ACC0WFY6_9STRA|nr:hypothetical protein PsorP6_018198 [Peronosclerospora sorghi]